MGLNGDQYIWLLCKILADHKNSNAAAATAVTCSVGITDTAACKSFMTNEVYLCSYVTVLQARQHAATHASAHHAARLLRSDAARGNHVGRRKVPVVSVKQGDKWRRVKRIWDIEVEIDDATRRVSSFGAAQHVGLTSRADSEIFYRLYRGGSCGLQI